MADSHVEAHMVVTASPETIAAIDRLVAAFEGYTAALAIDDKPTPAESPAASTWPCAQCGATAPTAKCLVDCGPKAPEGEADRG